MYVTNINNVLSGDHGDAIKGMSLEAIQRNVAKVPDAIRTPVINAGGKYLVLVWHRFSLAMC